MARVFGPHRPVHVEGIEPGVVLPVSAPSLGDPTDTPFVGTENGTARSLVSILKGIKNLLFDRLTTLGQKAMVGSMPVTVASDQSAVAVKAASGAIVSGAIASGAIASGAIASGAVASGAFVAGSQVDGHSVTLGLKTDAAIETDADGSVSGKVRGIIKMLGGLLSRWPSALGANGGLPIEGIVSGVAVPVSGAFYPATQPVSVAASQIVDGADVTQGALADAAVDGDTAGSVNAHLRGISKKIAAGVGVTGTFYQSVQPVSTLGKTISQTPTVTAGAYSVNDAVGGLLTFANASRISGAGGVVKSVLIVDDSGQGKDLELWLFSQTFTAMVDNAAWNLAAADLHNLVGIVATQNGAWYSAGTPKVAVIEVNQRFDCAVTSLFGQLVCRTAPTLVAATDITVILEVLQD